MNFDEVVATLQKRKGSGAWSAASKASGISYDTIVRIARGDIENPGVRTVERIAKALEDLDAQRGAQIVHSA